jgi:hypothetical protein
MLAIRLWYSKKNNRYYYDGDPQQCDVCSREIQDLIFIQTTWMGNQPYFKFFHSNCFNQAENLKLDNTVLITTIASKLPSDCRPIIPCKPVADGGRPSLGCVIDSPTLKVDIVIDRTRWAGRINKKAQLEVEHNQKLLEEKDERLDAPVLDIKSFLHDQREASITFNDKKLLENKE